LLRVHENVAPGTHVQRDIKARVFWRRVVAPPGSAARLSRLGSRPQLLPLIRQQLVEPAIRMRADPIQHDPQAYLRDVLDRISTHQAKRIAELLPDQWQELRQASGAKTE
jgi:predicted exporter